MQENTNKTIAVNTIILYVRLAVTMICTLFITRVALKALGVDDFGLFSVVGSVISFVAIINTIMISTTNRFIAVAIGKANEDEANRVFNVSLSIHLAIAVVTLLVAIPLGDWYIHNYINYPGPIDNALMVYRLAIIGSVCSFVSVPYNGLLTAKENFFVFCGVDIISQLLKLGAAVLMLYFFERKLLFYASTQAILTAYPTLVYLRYCNKHYPTITRWNIVRDKGLYKEMFGFSGWVGFGAIATVAKTQGAQLLVNAFFNTVMNAALGVANTINHFITMLANNVTQPMGPQLTKSYASGDMARCSKLLVMCTKFSFLTMLLVSSPFFSDIDWILNFWLGHVPPYASVFAKLLVLDALVGSFNSGIGTVIFANGKIVYFQVTNNTVNILSIFGAYFALKVGAPPTSVLIVFIIFTIFKILFTQLSLKRIGGFSFWQLFRESYLPSILVSILYFPSLLIVCHTHPFIHMVCVFAYLCIIVLFVGLTKSERQYLIRICASVWGKIITR